MDRLGLVNMDRVRVWIVRLVAPLAFVAAAVALVVLVQRALDDTSTGAAVPQATIPDTAEVTTVDTSAAIDAGEPQYYRIKTGDTLEGIAGRFSTTVDELLVLNPEITDAFSIQPGQRIRVA